MKTINQQLYKLQLIQLEHDEKYHKDISNLNLHHRLNHLVLHFAKYAGRFWELEQNKERWCGNDLKKLIIDTFIISLSACNTLNIYLDKVLTEDNLSISNLFELGKSLEEGNKNIQLNTLKQFSIYVGNMAKACESLDRLENISFRDIMIDNVILISNLTLSMAFKHKIDLYTSMQIRLREVEDKSIF